MASEETVKVPFLLPHEFGGVMRGVGEEVTVPVRKLQRLVMLKVVDEAFLLPQTAAASAERPKRGSRSFTFKKEGSES